MMEVYTKRLFQKRECVLHFVDKKDTEHISFILLFYRIPTVRDINDAFLNPRLDS